MKETRWVERPGDAGIVCALHGGIVVLESMGWEVACERGAVDPLDSSGIRDGGAGLGDLGEYRCARGSCTGETVGEGQGIDARNDSTGGTEWGGDSEDEE